MHTESKPIRIGSVVFDVNDFDKMMKFWQETLHYTPKYPAKDGWVILKDPAGTSPNVSVNLKPTDRKKIRMHLDIYAQDQEAEVQRLLKLGATIVRRPGPGHDFVIMSDPEGNHFCIIDRGKP